MVVTVMNVTTMMYGLYKWKSGIVQRSFIDIFFEIATMCSAFIMIGLYVSQAVFSLQKTLETIIVVAEISGTMLLARKHIMGWYLLIVMSSLVGYLVIFVNPEPAVILGILELASIYFYIAGIRAFRLHNTIIL